MKKKRTHTLLWHQLFCWVMALYVINVSIDAPDGYVKPNSLGEYHEDLSFNEIESVGELLLEHVFKFQNAVPEHDEPDGEEDQLSKIFFDWSLPVPSPGYQFSPVVEYIAAVVMAYAGASYFGRSAEVNTPPPQFA